MQSLPYWEMEPANEVVNPDFEEVHGTPYRTNFALAKQGACYLIYSRKGGAVSIKLPPGEYALAATRLVTVPAAGPARTLPASVSVAPDREFGINLESGNDWALILTRKK